MKRPKKYFFVPAIIVLVFLLSIDIKNYFMNGDILITNNDFLTLN